MARQLGIFGLKLDNNAILDKVQAAESAQIVKANDFIDRTVGRYPKKSINTLNRRWYHTGETFNYVQS